ncbi:ABC transporter permease subunit [Leeia sp. TBRC 13508]|uniref:ABC transporter permease subunit n=1 Tax=Leeia speluncae TaxID=2884804 RepID=A0ABS8DAG6_9NEIS|nr:ABC transporter permease subunit [Leeia speluncae]MCB6185200.1 ABC transporter permease subunit [Leeia speluncae]
MTILLEDPTLYAVERTLPQTVTRISWANRLSAALTSRVALSLLTIGFVILAWSLTSYLQWLPEMLLPTPITVVKRLADLAQNGFMDVSLWSHLWASSFRIGSAFLLAVATAIPAGIWMGSSRIGKGILDPVIEFYRPIPPLAYLPLMVIWFGIGELSKVLLIYFAIFAPLAIATANGVGRVSASRAQAALALGASKWQVLRYVVFPSALPDVLTGLRIALGAGWSTLVAAELIAATEGLGFMVHAASKFLVTDVVIAGILIIAAIALLLEVGLRYLQRKLTPWQNEV